MGLATTKSLKSYKKYQATEEGQYSIKIRNIK